MHPPAGDEHAERYPDVVQKDPDFVDALDLLVPGASQWRPTAVAWGVIALYLLLAVEVTSLLKRRVPTRLWRIDRFQAHVLNSGVFFRAATSRPMGNYFSPPLGGVPLTTKNKSSRNTTLISASVGSTGDPEG